MISDVARITDEASDVASISDVARISDVASILICLLGGYGFRFASRSI